jgi:hypothetical protein
MVTLTNVGSTYDAIPAAQGLGIAYADFTGKTQAIFRVRVQKIGTGVQSWQLWNETDGVQVGVIDDNAAAGNPKELEATFNINGTGRKKLRVRAKSTVAADDPVYLGGAVDLA